MGFENHSKIQSLEDLANLENNETINETVETSVAKDEVVTEEAPETPVTKETTNKAE